MFDFWETIGRYIADENDLRKQLLAETSLFDKNTADPRGVRIRNSKYVTLTSIVEPHLEYRPMSLWSKGELLRVLPAAIVVICLDKMGQRAEYLRIKLKGQTSDFYACLGTIAIDMDFGPRFAHDASLFPSVVNDPGLADLQKLAGDGGGSGSFRALVMDMCGDQWNPPCGARVELHPGNDQLMLGAW